jgi:iron(III) transport system ATP-binding protein
MKTLLASISSLCFYGKFRSGGVVAAGCIKKYINLLDIFLLFTIKEGDLLVAGASAAGILHYLFLPSHMVSIQIRNLTKRFGNTTALDNVSVRINAGELFFLLGPSGCGKTTLLRHIAGFYTPNSGQVLFDTQDVTFTPPHERNTAMMFQRYALWPHLSVAKNVAFGLEERKVDKPEIEDRVFKALATVRMDEYADRKINQLSGGQQQRVALARALVVRPQCLLLDEPLSNLDAKLRMQMRLEIRRICKSAGLTAIYVTHDQKEALSIADRMAVMENGRITQVGTPQQVYRSPLTKSVADFIGDTNFVPCVLGKPSRTEGYWIVDTKHGQFRGRVADRNWTPKEGQKATLSIRPECLTLAGNGTPSNTFIGKIKAATYLGEVAQYRFKTEDGPAINITELNPAHLSKVDEEDEEMFATVQPKDVVIIRE